MLYATRDRTATRKAAETGPVARLLPARLTGGGPPVRKTDMSIVRLDKGPRMSEAVIHGNTVYLAGQVAEGADVATQTRGVLAQIDALLERAGTSKANILTATIWLSDIADFAEMNSVWDSWVDKDNPPARATSEGKLAAPKFKVEIIVVAAK